MMLRRKGTWLKIEFTSIQTYEILVKRSTDEERTYDLLLRITI